MNGVEIRRAEGDDWIAVRTVLEEAARWLLDRNDVMWSEGELDASRIRADVDRGLYHLVFVGGEVAGTFRFQLSDPEFWPDLDAGEDSTFIHRLAVRRAFAGRGISATIFEWALERTRTLERDWLRLDCDADRTRLRAVYEGFGFRVHDYRQVGPYFVARYELPVSRG